MALKSLPKPTEPPTEIPYYARKRIERNVEQLRALSDLTDLIESKYGDLDPVAGAFGALIDAVADDLERLTTAREEVAIG